MISKGIYRRLFTILQLFNSSLVIVTKGLSQQAFIWHKRSMKLGFTWFSWTCTSCVTLGTHLMFLYVLGVSDHFDWILPLLKVSLETSDMWRGCWLPPPPPKSSVTELSAGAENGPPSSAKKTWREVSDVWAKALPVLLNRVGRSSHYGDKLSKWRFPLICEGTMWQTQTKTRTLQTFMWVYRVYQMSLYYTKY